MLCEKCGINTATFHYTEVVNGIKSEHHLCKQCVVGTDMSYYTSFFDNDAQFKKLLSGLLASQSDGENDVDSDDPANKVHCPKCGMSYAEFIENSVFGCPDCYDVFGPLISDTIRKIQGSDRKNITIPFIRQLFFRLQFVKSITQETIFSKTANTVESAAKDMKTKNILPQNLPPAR